jgi:dUTP pyrophosphatase
MKVKVINRSDYSLPAYETTGSAGLDLRANLETPVSIQPMERLLIETGIFIELPQGYEAQIRPRSGLAVKKGITLLNTPGTIDSDYRGELKIILINLSNTIQIIEPGERIAQMIVARYERIAWEETSELETTTRGAGGFGHTGTK